MALAALTTGGTFSERGGGRTLGTTRPSLVVVLEEEAVVRATLRDVVVVVEVFAPTPMGGGLPSDPENSWRRTGSEPAWNLEATAGVFKKAPGTGRTGVVWGNDMMASRTTLAGA